MQTNYTPGPWSADLGVRTVLETWNRPQMLRDWRNEDDFVAAFVASPDVDELDDKFADVEAAARAYWRQAVAGD